MDRAKLTIGVPIFVVLVILAAIAVYTAIGIEKGTIHIGDNSEYQKYVDDIYDTKYSLSGAGEKWNEGVIEYNGEQYKYNTSIKTYLIMGVDREGKAVKAADYVSGGQSDAMFLLVSDDMNKTISIIPINRNTMTAVKLCDAEGKYTGTFRAQICLQHGYGDGMRDSCQKTVDAVSKLFYNIPISGYIALNMDAMMLLNNMAGGVEVEVLEDISYPSKGVNLTAGETKVLTDEEAYAYLRYRDINVFGTANRRLEREKQYLLGLYENLKAAAGGSTEKALDMYNILEPYIVTNIEFANIAEDLMSYGFDQDNMYEIPGELKQGKKLEEFYVDKEKLYDIILKVLYVK